MLCSMLMCLGERIIVSLVPPRGMRFVVFGGIFVFPLWRLGFTGDLGHGWEVGWLINRCGSIACEFGGMLYGPIGSRYCHRLDLSSENFGRLL